MPFFEKCLLTRAFSCFIYLFILIGSISSSGHNQEDSLLLQQWGDWQPHNDVY